MTITNVIPYNVNPLKDLYDEKLIDSGFEKSKKPQFSKRKIFKNYIYKNFMTTHIVYATVNPIRHVIKLMLAR